MMTRRELLAIAGAGAAAALVGCDNQKQSQSSGTPSAVPDVLIVDVSDGLAVVRGGAVSSALGGALATLGGSRLFTTTAAGDDTVLRTIDTTTGTVVSKQRLAGRWVPRSGSANGQLVALTAPAATGATTFLPAGRRRTEIVVASPDREVLRLDLPGNLVPDAFTATGNGLFVLDWLPPTDPHHYRVRCIDFTTRQPTPLNTIAKVPVPAGAEEQMRGEGRLAVFGKYQSMLYTLYTHQPDHQHTRDLVADKRSNVHAFVHSLHLEQKWAYCVDLPAPFGEAHGSSYTVATDPAGKYLHVYDAAAGKLAITAADLLSSGVPQPVEVVSAPKAAGIAYAAETTSRLFVSAGPTVHALRPGDGGVIATWPVNDEVRGLAVSADGRRLYVGQRDKVTALDAGSGAVLGTVAARGLVAVRQSL